MAIPTVVMDSLGQWVGNSKLNWRPEGEPIVEESNSTLEISFDAHDAYATLRYSWEQDGKPQFGEMLICGPSVGWCDTWHQSGSVMHLVGEGDGLRVLGSYSWEGSPPWGWRIEITNPVPDRLLLTMTNICPDGEEEWAVRGEYSR